ncbi:MAG: LEA type 2 family protein [Desulfobacteraceae bacterium]|jgi:LEA14-like dessication related protein
MAVQTTKLLTVCIVSAISALSLAGCAGVGKTLEPPRVTLANIQVEEVKAFETVFQIELRVFNTNDIPIEINGIDCELEINGRKFASGVSKVEKEIPSYGTDTVPITLYSSVLEMVRGFLNLPDKEKLQYKISGRVRLGGGPLVPSVVPFESAGEFSLERLNDST